MSWIIMPLYGLKIPNAKIYGEFAVQYQLCQFGIGELGTSLGL